MSERFLPSENEVLFTAELDGEQIAVTRYNTVLQFIKDGDGIFNHCALLVQRDDGAYEAKRYKPSDDQWDILQNTVIISHCTERPDEETFLLSIHAGAFENLN